MWVAIFRRSRYHSSSCSIWLNSFQKVHFHSHKSKPKKPKVTFIFSCPSFLYLFFFFFFVNIPIIPPSDQLSCCPLSLSKRLSLTFSFCLSFSQRLVFASLIQHLIKVMLTALLHLLIALAIFVGMRICVMWKAKLALHVLRWPTLKENPLRAKAFASPFRLRHEGCFPAICSSFRL